MQLKCKIHNKEYSENLVQGITFREEYNETLDSAVIILSGIEKIKNLNPYDDVYIYNNEFKGFDGNGNLVGNNKPTFYKHMLVDQFTEEKINLKENIYKYKIELFSETKGLETIQLPNISITQPLNNSKKISVLQYLKQYIDMYSPKVKKGNKNGNKQWANYNKYKLSEGLADIYELSSDETMENIFGNNFTPDFTLNSPNLRDVLSKLMIVKDRIPYVYNNVIYALDITKRRGNFDLNYNEINYITSSKSSDNYCDNLKRTYSNALGQNNTCKVIENINFRNSDKSLMKFADLRLETRFPIYKINKVYLQYYKKIRIGNINNNLQDEDNARTMVFLCKQDITPYVKLNSERNFLNKNFDEMEKLNLTEEQLSKYYYFTVGYDIGSKYITGWSENYKYIRDVGTPLIQKEKSIIQNIAEVLNSRHPFGIEGLKNIIKYIGENEAISTDDTLFIPANGIINRFFEDGSIVTPYSNKSLALKSFFFTIEYDGFYNGTIVTTKDGAQSDITINDNPSSSLTLLENDGLAQKEKINRFGNKGYTIPAIYNDISRLQPLGSVFDNDEEEDIIIYHREYSINDKVINCTYYGMKDYVLKNYFTSVYAKHRPYNLMSYGESVTRAENLKKIILLSKNKLYFEQDEIFDNASFGNKYFEFVHKIFSCFEPFKEQFTDTVNYFNLKDKINCVWIYSNTLFYDKDTNEYQRHSKRYLSDLNVFMNGNSLCFNTSFFDNVSMGVYISKHEPFETENGYLEIIFDNEPENDYSGSIQNWYLTADDAETGFLKEIDLSFRHMDSSEIIDSAKLFTEGEAKNSYKNILFKLPNLPGSYEDYNTSNSIGRKIEINKDNKEIIDITYQLEPISDNNDIVFSPWMLKLSDLLSNYPRITKIEKGNAVEAYFEFGSVYSFSAGSETSMDPYDSVPYISFYIPTGDLYKNKKILTKNNTKFNKSIKFYLEDKKAPVLNYELTFIDIDSISSSMIVFNVQQITTVRVGNEILTIPENKQISLNVVPNDNFNNIPSGYTKFSNIEFIGDIINDNRFITYDGNKIVKFGSYTDTSGEQAVEKFYYRKKTNLTFNYDGRTQNIGFPNTSEGNNSGEPTFYLDATPMNVDFLKPMDVEKQIAYIVDDEQKNFFYTRNMFVVFSQEKISKDIIYDEYFYQKFPNETPKHTSFRECVEQNKNLLVEDIFRVKYEDLPHIHINLDVDLSFKPKSVQFWYLDGVESIEKDSQSLAEDYSKASYKFVFGANISDEEWERKESKIYISVLGSMDKKIYDINDNTLIGENYNYISDFQEDIERYNEHNRYFKQYKEAE